MKINNLVAKYAHKFNKSSIIENKKKVYKRKQKHQLKDYSNLLFI